MDTSANVVHEKRASRSSSRLRIARVFWAVLVFLALWFFFTGIPIRYEILQTPCAISSCAPLQLTPDRIQLLSSIPMLISTYAGYVLAIELAIAIGFIGAGAVIAWRRLNTPIGLFISLAFFTFGSNIIINGTGGASFREWGALSVLVTITSWLGFALVFYLFPDGKFTPPWIRVVVFGMLLLSVIWIIFDLPRDPDSWAPMQALAVVLFLGAGVLTQVYRYRTVSTQIQRQQTKWVVIGMVAAVMGGGVVSFLSSLVGQSLRSAALTLIIAPLASLFFLCLPVAFVIALLRYRLWDVDRVISRALVYVPLTAILAGILAATQAILQKVMVALTGSSSDITTIITTLLLVSLFTPLQTSLQTFVDKRFKVELDPTAKLQALSSRVQTLIDVLDVPIISLSFLEEAVRAFGSSSGAIYLMDRGQLQLIHKVGAWQESISKLSVPLKTDNLVLGQLCIAARDDKTEYSNQEKEVLEKLVIPLARTIKLTRQMLA